MKELIIQPDKLIIDNTLQISSIKLKEDYCIEWNERLTDFVVLSKNGELVNNTLYRLGGNYSVDIKQDYFILLKYVEAVYEMNFLKKCYPNKSIKELKLKRKHLQSHSCILDKNGIEKKVFEHFKNPYLIKNSCIYSVDRGYYNIETGEFYCNASNSMESSEYLFLENKFDKELSKIGVMKINKKDGTNSIFS